MSFADAPLKDVPTSILIDRLAAGWREPHSGLALELVHRWELHFGTSAEIKELRDNSLYFVTDLSEIYLRDTHRTPCLMLGGDVDVTQVILDFFRRIPERYGVPVMLALSERTFEVANSCVSRGRGLLIRVEELKRMMKETPYPIMKKLLREQVSRRRLDPYNLLLPAQGSVFVGRKNELERLFGEESTSFAIAGPGRIGKSSLMHGYKELLRRTRDPRVTRYIEVDFYECEESNDDGIARYFATRIDASSRSWKMTPQKLVNFMRMQKQRLGGPPDLLLDEVDLVCNSEAFKSLGVAARGGLCRLIMCGKGELLKTMFRSKSPLECRLELIHLEPLDEVPAFDLLVKPLLDLGFEIVDPKRFADRVFKLTGRLPHLIQFCGQKVIEYAIRRETELLTDTILDDLEADFVTAQYFMQPLEEVKDPATKLIGQSLIEQNVGEVSLEVVARIARGSGLSLEPNRIREICNDLVINNVLVWSNGSYRLASGGLHFYFKKMGALGGSSKRQVLPRNS